ncbi:signal peptidase II [Clostridium sporogenes]|nr:signal peptidase II [Clostridium sporogenes]
MVKYKPTSKLLKISLSLIISGAIGNLIDRIFYNFKFIVSINILIYKFIL